MNTVIRKIGNSEGVILPKELLSRFHLKAGDSIVIRETQNGFELTAADDAFESQIKAAREVMDRYKVALKKLAE